LKKSPEVTICAMTNFFKWFAIVGRLEIGIYLQYHCKQAQHFCLLKKISSIKIELTKLP